MPTDSKVTRGQLLKGAAASVPTMVLSGATRDALAAGGPEARDAANSLQGMNVMMFITDQERSLQHFPKGWGKKNLPGAQQLIDNGLVFKNAFTNACMCSPARATLMTGYMPAQHGVRYTLESDMPSDEYPQVQLSTGLKNIATVMKSVGYNVIYKGKFHLYKPPVDSDGNEMWSPADLVPYGFDRWDPPDAGANQDLDQGGGNVDPPGEGNNDARFMNDAGDVTTGDEGALAYLNNVASSQQPFFLIVSLVNPHDVLFYRKDFSATGYPASDLDGSIQLPPTVNEDLSTKPSAQASFKKVFNLTGPITGEADRKKYVNFYGNLIKEADGYLVQLLDALENKGLLDNTLVIKTSDHGEMGMSHSAQRQKCFNMYEESLKIPLVYSNPKLFPKPRTSSALVSHVDFLPTLAGLFAAPSSAQADWTGVDYSDIVLSSKAKPVQDYVMFTYDDFQAGQSTGPYVVEPNHIVAIREERWKFARYYDPTGSTDQEYEMYDLKNDPNEKVNLCAPNYKRTSSQQKQYKRLKDKLTSVEKKRLAPLAGTQVPISITGNGRQQSKSVRAGKITFKDTGHTTGTPLGKADMSIEWVLDAASGTGKNQLTLSCGAGVLFLTSAVNYTTDVAADSITLTGTANLWGGTGAFRDLKAEGLSFRYTDNLQGTAGNISLSGTATYQ